MGCEKSFIFMKLMWHNYLVVSMINRGGGLGVLLEVENTKFLFW